MHLYRFGVAELILLGVSAAALLPAQSQPVVAPLAFDVASVKPSGVTGNGVRGTCHGIDSVYAPDQKAEAPSLGRCVITDARLSHLIFIAWNLSTMQQIKSEPEWIARGDERFDVVAKAEDPSKATEQQLFAMLQTLLIDRFQLKFHRETVEMPGFALVIAKGGSKLQESKSDQPELSPGARTRPKPGGPATVHAHNYSMAMLMELLSGVGGHGQGVDKTGLTGRYDFTLSWDEQAGPSITTALQQQLGLKMESMKTPVSYFIVDSAQRPSAN